MTKRAFDKIKAGLDDARAFLEGTADTNHHRAHGQRSAIVETDMLSKAKAYCFELPSAMLRRGFWIYVWKIQQQPKARPLLYVGMTGDTGSFSAQSPINRVSAHLGSNERSNALQRYANQHQIKLEDCWKIEFFAYGPISSVPTSKTSYSAERMKVAALEKAVWLALKERKYDLINTCPKCRSKPDPENLEKALEAFADGLKSA